MRLRLPTATGLALAMPACMSATASARVGWSTRWRLRMTSGLSTPAMTPTSLR
uniref:Uncharacterized protein n=1 Tax=uncultured marine virus TaxID=186617 RepID=A0A0F7L3M0_9VIRU|nr:hypothetical protein [uncultured marine virus]